MDSMDVKRKRLELARVEVARQELEFKIEEREEEIKRLKDHIQIQKNKEEEIKQDIIKLKGDN